MTHFPTEHILGLQEAFEAALSENDLVRASCRFLDSTAHIFPGTTFRVEWHDKLQEMPTARNHTTSRKTVSHKQSSTSVYPISVQHKIIGNLSLAYPYGKTPDESLVKLAVSFLAMLAGTFDRIEKTAVLDPLTGLLNRKGLTMELPRSMAAASRGKTPLSLLLFDVDRFKKLNDTFGHNAGDAVLTGIAIRLKETARASDVPGRYGGDEFFLILPNTDYSGCRSAAERIVMAIGKTAFTVSGHAHDITLSAGGITIPPDTRPSEIPKVIDTADKALYNAKRSGGNRSEVSIVYTGTSISSRDIPP